jgi:SAM-dependent methyltransferase
MVTLILFDKNDEDNQFALDIENIDNETLSTLTYADIKQYLREQNEYKNKNIILIGTDHDKELLDDEKVDWDSYENGKVKIRVEYKRVTVSSEQLIESIRQHYNTCSIDLSNPTDSKHDSNNSELATEQQQINHTMNMMNRELFALAKSLIKSNISQTGLRVLDAHGGRGQAIHRLHSIQAHLVTAIDISDVSIEQYKERHKTKAAKLEKTGQRLFTLRALTGDVFNKHTYDTQIDKYEQYDLVISSLGLHYAASSPNKLRSAIYAMTHRLVSNGVFLVLYTDGDTLVQNLQLDTATVKNKYSEFIFDLDEIKQINELTTGVACRYKFEPFIKPDIEEYVILSRDLIQYAGDNGLVLKYVHNIGEYYLGCIGSVAPLARDCADLTVHRETKYPQLNTEQVKVLQNYRVMIFVKE